MFLRRACSTSTCATARAGSCSRAANAAGTWARRSSFVLWEQALGVVGEAIDRGILAEEVCLVFAGGIHDARSAALVAALAGPLAGRGVKVGVLVGTGYLFTQEAVTTGAIVAGFQDEVMRCEETVLLESGPGHQVRVSRTPFVARFEEEKNGWWPSGARAEEIREALEGLNVGRLRVATKGVDRTRGAGAHSGVGERRLPGDSRPVHARPGRRAAHRRRRRSPSCTARSAPLAPS